MKVKFHNLRTFIYKYQFNNFVEEEKFIKEDIYLDEIFSFIILNSKNSLKTVAINGFKTIQSLRNMLNSLVECKNLIELDILRNPKMYFLYCLIEHNQSHQLLNLYTPDWYFNTNTLKKIF